MPISVDRLDGIFQSYHFITKNFCTSFFRIQRPGFVLFTTFKPESLKSAIRIAKKAVSNDAGFFYLQGETGEQGEAGEKGISGEKVT